MPDAGSEDPVAADSTVAEVGSTVEVGFMEEAVVVFTVGEGTTIDSVSCR